MKNLPPFDRTSPMDDGIKLQFTATLSRKLLHWKLKGRVCTRIPTPSQSYRYVTMYRALRTVAIWNQIVILSHVKIIIVLKRSCELDNFTVLRFHKVEISTPLFYMSACFSLYWIISIYSQIMMKFFTRLHFRIYQEIVFTLDIIMR